MVANNKSWKSKCLVQALGSDICPCMEIKLIYLIALKIEIICTKHEDSCTVIIYSMSVTVVIVTEQTRLQPRGTLTHGPTISAEENRFLLTGFQPWGRGWCWDPFSPTGLSSSLASQKATSQNHAPKFPISLSVLNPAVQTDPHPLWNVHLWVSESPSSHSSSLLQGLGCAVLSLHAVVQENMCCVTLGHGGVQGGTRPKRVTSPSLSSAGPSEKQKSAT